MGYSGAEVSRGITLFDCDLIYDNLFENFSLNVLNGA